MEHRPLGRTGVSVSKLCLGAMMFGDWGDKDHDESIRIIHRALDAGINFVDTATFTGRGIRGDRRRGPVRRPARRRRARHQGLGPDGRGSQPSRLAPLEWASCPIARWRAGGCQVAGTRTPSSRPRRAPPGSPSASKCRCPPTSASSMPSSSSQRSPTRQGSRSSSSRSRSLNHPTIIAPIIGPRTMEHLESQLARATSSSTRHCWTASTRSSRPARPSTQPTTPGLTQRWSQRPAGARSSPRGRRGACDGRGWQPAVVVLGCRHQEGRFRPGPRHRATRWLRWARSGLRE
jgi:hypothetical protein